MTRHRGKHRKKGRPVWRRLLQASALGAAVATVAAALWAPKHGDTATDVGEHPFAVSPSSNGEIQPAVSATALPDLATAASAAAAAAATPPPTTTPAPTTKRRPAPTTPRATPAPAVVAAPPASSRAQRIIATARLYFGVPYVWGGTTRAGMDCSGLTYTVLRTLGLNPPRTAAQQANWTTRVSADDARPGDLVFKGSPATHVGIYIGNGRMIDSSTYGTVIAERPVLAGAYYGRLPS